MNTGRDGHRGRWTQGETDTKRDRHEDRHEKTRTQREIDG